MLRLCQYAGLLVVAVSAFLPTFHFTSLPVTGAHTSSPSAGIEVLGRRERPAFVLGEAVVCSVDGTAQACPFWDVRRWYPWYLVLLWAPALLLVRGRAPDSKRRRLAGGLMWLATFGLIAFEFFYLRAEYLPFLPGGWGTAERVGAWLFVVFVLLYRRKADRTLGAVEATVAAQALLGFIHALTLPSTMARGWLGRHEPGAVLEAVWTNFPPSFWIGCAGLLLLSLPIYLRPAPDRAPAEA